MDTSRFAGTLRWALGEIELRRGQLVLAGMTLAFLVVVTHPWLPPLLTYETLDGGYRAVLNVAFQQGELFGPEVVTTTGPLGFLRNQVHFPGTDVYRVLWGTAWAAALALLMAKLFLRRSLWWSVATYGCAVVCLCLVYFDGWRVLPLVAFLYLFAKLVDREPRTAPWEWCILAVLAVDSWILFTDFLTSVVAVGGATAVHWARHRKIPPTPAIFLVFLAAAWFAAGQSLGNVVSYFRTSLEVSLGYADVMTRYCGLRDPLLVLGAFGLLFAFLAWATLRAESRLVSAAFLVPLLGVCALAFKTSFTRCSAARSEVIALLLIFLALAATSYAARRVEGRQGQALGGGLVALALGLALLVSVAPAEPNPLKFDRALAQPAARWSGLMERLFDRDRLGKARSRYAARLWDEVRMPQVPGPVDLFGDRQGLVVSHQLEYVHRPVFQRFTAYTPHLAQLNADYFAGPEAPPYVLYDHRHFNNFVPTLLDARAFVELVAGYRAVVTGDEFTLLEKSTRRPFSRRQIDEATVGLREWYVLPKDFQPLWVELDVHDTFRGRVQRAAFKLPRIWIDLHVGDGSIDRKILASVPARGGFWLSPMPRGVRDTIDLFTHGPEGMSKEARVIRFRVVEKGQDPSGLRGPVDVRLYRLIRD